MSSSFIFLFIIIFVIIIYFYTTYSKNKYYKEGYTNENINQNKNELRCPNLLVKKHSKFFLYNHK